MYYDRVLETTTTTGTGTITLAGAATGYRTFTSAIATDSRVCYVIAAGAEWEVGDGVLLTSSTLSRENIYSSSNSGNAVNFSAGTKNVWVDLAAQRIADIGIAVAIKMGGILP